MLLVHLLNELKTHDENKTCRDSGLSPLHSIMWDSALANQSERSLPSAASFLLCLDRTNMLDMYGGEVHMRKLCVSLSVLL